MAKGWTIRWNYMGHELERIGKRVRGRPWRNGTAQACTGERREGRKAAPACVLPPVHGHWGVSVGYTAVSRRSA